MIATTQRVLRDRTGGGRYAVALAPHELPGGLGVDPSLNAVVFQDLRTWQVYSCPVDGREDLSDFSDRELRVLLKLAR